MARARWLLLVPIVGFVLSWIPFATRPPVGETPFDYLFDGVTGIVIAVAGLIAWGRRPSNPTGRILVVAGYLWYVGSLANVFPPDGLFGYVAWIFRGLYDPLVAWVVLTFPRGRLETRADRFGVAALAAVLLARTGWRLIGSGPGSPFPDDWPANPLQLFRDRELYFNVDVFLFVFLAAALGLVAILAIRRWRRLPSALRRVAEPVLATGVVWGVVSGAYALDEWLHWWLRTDVLPWEGPGWSASFLVRTLAPIGLLVGAWRLRSRTGAVVELVSGSTGALRGAELQAALRRALIEPSVVLLYPTGTGGWVDVEGRPAALPDADGTHVATLIEAGGRPIGAIVHDAVLLEDPAMVRTVAAVVRLAMDNERLNADLVTQLDEVRASRSRIVEATDAERRRIERDIHDGAQQRLVGLAVALRTIRHRLGSEAGPEVIEDLDAADGDVRATIEELRELARGLDPAILRSAGLGSAIASLAGRSPIPVRLGVELDGRLPSRVETTAYFVTAEGLANVAKHAAASTVDVRASVVGDELRLEIADDGIGGADAGGSGLRGLADRVAAVGGTFDVASDTGGGTRLVARIPCVS